MHLIPRASERDVEHALHMLAVGLPRRERRLRHPVGVVGKRIEDHVALVALKTIRIHHHQIVRRPQLFRNLIAYQIVHQAHLLFEQADDAERCLRITRMLH